MEPLLILLQRILHHLNTNQEGVKIAVPLEYLSNFWRSLEMSLINRKVELSLKWYSNCILSSEGTATSFAITDTKSYFPVATLKIEDNTKLSKLLSKAFKRTIYWNEYKVTSNINYAENEYIRERLDASIQGVNRLCVFPYMRGDNFTTENSCDKYFLQRFTIDNYNIENDGRNFYDQGINVSIKQYNKIRKYQQDKLMITQMVVY